MGPGWGSACDYLASQTSLPAGSLLGCRHQRKVGAGSGTCALTESSPCSATPHDCWYPLGRGHPRWEELSQGLAPRSWVGWGWWSPGERAASGKEGAGAPQPTFGGMRSPTAAGPRSPAHHCLAPPTAPARGGVRGGAGGKQPPQAWGRLAPVPPQDRPAQARALRVLSWAIIYVHPPMLYGFLNSAPATINVVNAEIISIFWRQAVIYSSHFSGGGSHAVKSSALPIKC